MSKAPQQTTSYDDFDDDPFGDYDDDMNYDYYDDDDDDDDDMIVTPTRTMQNTDTSTIM